MRTRSFKQSLTTAEAKELLQEEGYKPLGRVEAERFVQSGQQWKRFKKPRTVVFAASNPAVFVLVGRGPNECYVYKEVLLGWWISGTRFAVE